MFSGFSETFLYFIIYSFVGWVCECVFCTVIQKQTVNRGMLKGPYCPIYGLGALFVLPVATPLREYPLLVFLAAMLVTSALEYFASWLLEKLFHMRWWDYTGQRFQLNGRICLPLALAFGAMGWVLTYAIHPVIARVVSMIPYSVRTVASNALIAVFLLDLVATVGQIMGVSQRLQELQNLLMELKTLDEQYTWLDRKDWKGSLVRLRSLCEQQESAASGEVMKRLEGIESIGRELQSFVKRHPTLDARKWREAVGIARGSVSGKIRARGQGARGFFGRAGAGVKTAGRSVAARFHYYDLFWVFFIAGVIGYLVETLFCLLTTGVIESRQGLLYGPFNQVYGFGAVLMVLLLEPLRQRSDRWLFFGGALLGGAFEVLCSLIQEAVFGSVSWDYREGAFPIAGGRTSLLFMFFWGVLGVWFIKGVYPRLGRLVARIPKKQGIPLTAVWTVLICVNMILSGAAVRRWSERAAGQPPENCCEQFLDSAYPDEYMEGVYPNLTMLVEMQ